MKDYYAVLGLNKNASFDDIKQSYKVWSQRYHPDKDTADPVELEKVREAYDTLGDATLRAEFDLGEEYAPAIELLQKSMVDMIHNTVTVPIDNVDLVLSLKCNIQDVMEKEQQTIEGINELVIKFNKSINKIRKKNRTSGNIFTDAILKRVEKHEKEITIIENDLKLQNKMLEVLNKYEENTTMLLTHAIYF